MTRLQCVGKLASYVLIVISAGLLASTVCATEFRSLLSSNLDAGIPNTYTGHVITGNTITHMARFRNISSRPFVIHGVTDIQSLDPEDLGFPDMTPANSNLAIAAMEQLLPTYDLFNSTAWVNTDPIRMTWTTEIAFTEPFPIRVDPGDSFRYIRVSRNQLFGPTFGPSPGPLPPSIIQAIGELVVGFELDWEYVPEPGTGTLLMLIAAYGSSRRAVARISS